MRLITRPYFLVIRRILLVRAYLLLSACYSGPSFERPHLNPNKKWSPKQGGLPPEEGGAIGGALQEWVVLCRT